MLGFWADCRICGFAGVIAEMYASVRRKISGTERQRAAAVSAIETRQKNMQQGNSLCGRNLRGAHRSAERPASTNTSGHRGVYRRSNGTWRASIGFQGKVYNLGTFTAFNEAVQARVKAEKELYDPFIRSFQAQKKKTSGNEIPSCAVGAEKQMEEVLAE